MEIFKALFIMNHLYGLHSQVTVDMIRRAEQANFKALVVTVDTAILGRRLATERNELR